MSGTSSADNITNSGSRVTILGGKGNDKFYNEFGNNTSISAGAGNDSIYNRSFYTTILGGSGKDTVENYNGAWALINTGDGNDSITNINAYDDDGHYVTISSGAGDDKISNQMGNYASINAGAGNDSIYDGSWFSTILGGAGNDSIKIDGDTVTVDAGAGNDYLEINSKNVSIVGGTGNDTIVNNGTKNIYKYTNGDGKDVIYNLGSTDTVVISGNTYTKKISGNDVILTVGKGKITLKDAKGKTLNINGTLKGGKSTLSIPTNAYTYKGHSYYIFNNKSTWETAQAYCESRGGHLAVINNAKENTKLFKYMKSKGYDSAYFGLSDMAEEGTWTWANGDKVSYTNWASSEPNGGTNENYGMFYSTYQNGEWNDGNFGSEDITTFICEWDTVTTSSASTLSIPADSYTYNGHSYKLFNDGKTWKQAKTYCENFGGHLVTITDKSEQSAIQSLVNSKGAKNGYWMGGFKSGNSWKWTTGETWSYKNFADNEPNGSGDYLQMYGKNNAEKGKWDDTSNDLSTAGVTTAEQGFICEWDTVTTGGGTSTVTVPPDTVPSGDVLKGTNGHDNLKNGTSNYRRPLDAGKVIYAYAGNDTVTNYANNVYISGGAGNDYITSNYGSNVTVHGDTGADNITVSSNNALVYGDAGNDKIITYNEGNFIYGGKGADYIETRNNNNGYVSGDAGNDTITAYKGTFLTLSGGAGNDYLWGGANSDTLIGGSGDDIFVYKPNEGTDHITDFSGGDMLKILKINGNEGGTFTSATYKSGNLTLAISGGGSVILENVSSGQSININDTTYKISGKTLK